MILSATADNDRTDKRSAARAPGNDPEAASTKSSNSRSKFVENNLLDENTNKNGDSAPESFVSSINCVEQADGARLITVTLNEEPEVTAEKKESSNLVLKFRPRGNSSTTLADNKNGDSAKIRSCRVECYQQK